MVELMIAVVKSMKEIIRVLCNEIYQKCKN